MLTETFRRIPFPVIGRCSPLSTRHWLQENAPNLLAAEWAFLKICTVSIFKGARKKLNFCFDFFSITSQQKMVKTII